MKPSGKKGTGDIQPPKNKIDARKILKSYLHIQRKKTAKAVPEYST